MHRNIISIVKLTRCTNVSNLFYFRMTVVGFTIEITLYEHCITEGDGFYKKNHTREDVLLMAVFGVVEHSIVVVEE